VTVDTAAPVAAPVAEVKRADDGASVAAATNTKTVMLRGTAESGAVVKVYGGGAVVATTTADASGAWSATASNLAEGTHNFTTTVTDAAGNESVASVARAVTVDTAQ
jgi:large repetitive protein